MDILCYVFDLLLMLVYEFRLHDSINDDRGWHRVSITGLVSSGTPCHVSSLMKHHSEHRGSLACYQLAMAERQWWRHGGLGDVSGMPPPHTSGELPLL